MSQFGRLTFMKEGNLTLSQQQLKTWTIINRFIQKDITRQQAADLLGLSTRQISCLKKGVLTSGPESLIHKNTDRKPAHALKDETKKVVLSIYSRPEFSGGQLPPFPRNSACGFRNRPFLLRSFQCTILVLPSDWR